MKDTRKWAILSAISAGTPVSQIDPPLNEAEIRYYETNLAPFLQIKSNLPANISLQFVPTDDSDCGKSAALRHPFYPAKQTEPDILKRTAHYLLMLDTERASELVRKEYPFDSPKKGTRNYTMEEMLDVFIRDGFIDRYSGQKLIHPGMLRAMSELLAEGVFPYEPHWKTSDCHPAYWKYQPSIDHKVPVSLNGEDKKDNWITTSFSRNQAKGNASLEQIGWEIKPCGNFEEWDGLTHDFLAVYELYPNLHKVDRIRKWYQATVKVMHLV